MMSCDEKMWCWIMRENELLSNIITLIIGWKEEEQEQETAWYLKVVFTSLEKINLGQGPYV